MGSYFGEQALNTRTGSMCSRPEAFLVQLNMFVETHGGMVHMWLS